VASPEKAGDVGDEMRAPAPLPPDVWRVSRWNDAPSNSPPRRPTFELAVIGILLLWNVTANLVIPEATSLPLSVVGAALLLVLAHRNGLSWDYLGLQKELVGTSLRVGIAALGVVIATIGVVAAIPASRELLADDRFLGVGFPEMLYEALIRIPIGTALAEELAFRGVVLGMLLVWMTPLRAVVVSSALFGLWHILPAIEALETNPAADLASGTFATVAEVAVQVIVTGVAGTGFAWLRLRGRGIAAPALAHWGLNGAAYAVGFLVVRNGWA